MPFKVRAMNLDYEWIVYDTDDMILALEKFKDYIYAGYEKVRIFYIYK